MADKQTAGRKLFEARVLKNLTQADVAKGVGTSQANISRIEKGEIGSLTTDLLERVSAFLQVNPEEIMSIQARHIAESKAKPAVVDVVIEKIKEIGALKAEGLITDEEFSVLKAKIFKEASL